MKSTPIKTKILKQDDNSQVVIELHDCYISIMQDADLIVVRNANLPKLIKALQSFVVMLLLSVSAYGDSFSQVDVLINGEWINVPNCTTLQDIKDLIRLFNIEK